MTRDLPFEIRPTVQYHEIGDGEAQGLLKFRRVGGVSIPERNAVIELDRHGELFVTTAAFCQQVQTDKAIALADEGLATIYQAVDQTVDSLRATGRPGDNPLHVELALTYAKSLLEQAAERDAMGEAMLVRKATTMIQNRLRGCQDWTDDDTLALDRDGLIVEIAAFYDREAAGMFEGATGSLQEQIRRLEADLGKQLLASGNPSPTPTGESSTGSADSSTEPHLSSDPIASAVSPSATSSRPSKRAAKQSRSASTARK